MIWNENKDETVGVESIWLNEIGKERIEYIQIVRCKDCKNFRSENYVAPCKKVMRSEDADENWFCADGERR